MLYEITAHILVNVDDERWPDHQDAVVTDGLNEGFRFHDDGFVIDWSYDVNPNFPNERDIIARPDLDLGSYEEGDFRIKHDAMQHDDCAACGTAWS